MTITLGGLQVKGGGITVTNGVTINDSGLTVTAGGIRVTTGGITVAGGNIIVTSTVVQTSDRRLKTNFLPISNALRHCNKHCRGK